MVISSEGLKNIVFEKKIEEDKFNFLIGKEKIEIRRFFADFISPRVSQIHQCDPTIDTINLNELIAEGQEEKVNQMITSDFVENVRNISSGYSIEISEERMRDKLLLFSILIGNKELHCKLNEGQETKIIDEYFKFIDIFKEEEIFTTIYENPNYIEYISSHFYEIEEDKLFKLPIKILYSILNNEHLKVQNEDSLFDFINKITTKANSSKEEEIKEIRKLFYEIVEFPFLSENKFNEFIENLDVEYISPNIFQRLKKYIKYEISKENYPKTRYYETNTQINSNHKETTIEYDNNSNHRFKGIIDHLGNRNSKNVIDQKIINFTASSVTGNSENYQPDKSVEYENKSRGLYYHSEENDKDAWLCIDFKERKIKPSHYSLKSYASNRGFYNIQSWNIEGSNDLKEWDILDDRRNDKNLDEKDATNTFKIKNINKFYRYLRIHHTGPNTYSSNNDYRFIIRSLEYFGTIQEP